MSNEKDPRTRRMEKNEAVSTFMLQLRLFPELMNEFVRLSGGSRGVVNALIDTIGEEISYNPEIDTTVSRIREIVHAPEEDNQLYEWRTKFWDDFKASKSSS